jgi:hypothetical protein
MEDSFRLLVGALCLSIIVLPAKAETSLDPNRASTLSTLFGKVDPWNDPTSGAFAPKTAGDSDLGDQVILMPQGAYKPFSFRLTELANWTSNAALSDTNELEDFYSHTEASLQFVPQITGSTFADFSASYGIFRYSDNSSLDFDDFEASAGVIHIFRDLADLSVWFRYNHSHLLDSGDHDEIFTDHALEAGFYFPIPITTRQQTYVSYASEFSIDGNPRYAARNEHGLTLGYRLIPTDTLELTAHYSFYVFDYVEGTRTDLLHSAGLSLTTHLTKAIDATISGSYSLNDSNTSGGDYQVGDLGAILSIEIDF